MEHPFPRALRWRGPLRLAAVAGEARWARLSIIHRLDKETSGVIVFRKNFDHRQPLVEPTI